MAKKSKVPATSKSKKVTPSSTKNKVSAKKPAPKPSKAVSKVTASKKPATVAKKAVAPQKASSAKKPASNTKQKAAVTTSNKVTPAPKKAAPIAKKTTAAVKKTAPVAKKPAAASKKAVSTSKKITPTPKKATPVAKKSIVATKKTTVASPKKAAPVAAKKAVVVSKKENPKKNTSAKKGDFGSSPKLKKKDKNKDQEKEDNADIIPTEELDIIEKELLAKEEKLAKKLKQNQSKKNVPQTIKTIPSVRIDAVSDDVSLPKNFRNGGKEKFEMEFQVRSSIKILYNFISSPSGLSEWFSDDVNVQKGVFIFRWEGSEEEAKLLVLKEFELVRYKWLHSDDDDTYFEMKIKIEELTGDVAIVITDFSYKDELQESQLLWETQIQKLLKALGSA